MASSTTTTCFYVAAVQNCTRFGSFRAGHLPTNLTLQTSCGAGPPSTWSAPVPIADPSWGVAYSSLAFTPNGTMLNLFMACRNQTGDPTLCLSHKDEVIGVSLLEGP